MGPNLDAIKGGGGSIRVGTTGTISSLMTREMTSVRSSPRTQPFSSNNGTSPPKRVQRKSLDEASTSGTSKNISRRRSADFSGKIKSFPKSTHRIPMLGSDNNISLSRTPRRENAAGKKAINIVEIVDVKCGNPDKSWAITHRLKKLGFSKLSESII